MSASSNKKLRKEQSAEGLTEKQLAAKKEARNLKIYTALFIAAMVLIVLVAAGTLIARSVVTSGIRERNTTAVTIGDHALNSAELNYFFIDAVNGFYNDYNSSYGDSAASYLQILGLDLTKPLSEQAYYGSEDGETWADYFLELATQNAQSAYAIYDEALANGYEITESDQAAADNQIDNLTLYASIQGYPNAETYLKSGYGYGATLDSFRQYCLVNIVAQSYPNAYADALTYTDADIQAYNDEHAIEFNSYSFDHYYLSANTFLEGGTEDENGNVTHSEEEQSAAVEAAKSAADSLLDAESVEEFDALIAALPVNADRDSVASTKNADVLYTSISPNLQDWVTDASRKAGDMAVIPSESTSTAEDGTTTTTINGYYAVYFEGSTENNMPLANVRHILISSTDSSSDSEEADTPTAQEQAEALLEEWKAGEATEESFAALATEHSADTGSKDDGGLIEDIYPGQMVENFDAWCFDESRQPGDTGIVESTYGYHVMYYVGQSEMTYREYMIDNHLRTAAVTEWYTGLLEGAAITQGNTAYINKDLVFMTTNIA